jgi:transposase InsO family protein
MERVLGGKRGRLIMVKDREHAVTIIQEAITNGARLKRACDTVEISIRTYQRWKAGELKDKRKGAQKRIPRKLTTEEEAKIIRLCCSPEFKDFNPYDIFIILLETGTYIASIRTIYRVLKKANLLHHRSNKKPGTRKSAPKEAVATGPNQVWCWDITWLPTRVKGIFLYSYMIIDIWDKSIVGWSIHEEENEAHAKDLFDQVLAEQGYPDVHIHSDNGNPMKGLSLLALFYFLKISNTYSRPRVSNDNPFIESFFGTMKCSVKYPGRFDTIDEAREWMARFVAYYNTEHRHSGIAYFTPKQMRTGSYKTIVDIRNKTMQEAYRKNPARWSRNAKQWDKDFTVYLNPSLDTRQKLEKVA